MENSKKKKIMLTVLLLFIVIGITGYGVYSYYWTEGKFDGPYGDLNYNEKNVIYTDGSFAPSANYSGSPSTDDYIGKGGYISVSCDGDDTTGTVVCEGDLYVKNNGSTAVYINVVDDGSYADYSNLSVSNDPTLTYNWRSKTLAPNQEECLHISTTLNLDYGANSSTPTQVNEPVMFDNGQVAIYVKLKATQVRNND